MAILIIWIIGAAIAWTVANNKGRSTGGWTLAALLLSPLVVLILLVLPSIKGEDATRQCPYCAETIKAGASICRFCNKEVTPVRPIEEMKKCRSCGEMNVKGSLVCINCGKKMYAL